MTVNEMSNIMRDPLYQWLNAVGIFLYIDITSSLVFEQPLFLCAIHV